MNFNLEMQNIAEKGRASRGDIISTYQTVVRDSGIQNDGLYTVPLPSSEHNIDGRPISGTTMSPLIV